MNWKKRYWGLACALTATITLHGCDKQGADKIQNVEKLATPIKVEHTLGSTVIDHLLRRVAALDMNEVDFLDQLNIPIAGMPKDYIPHFLGKYKGDSNIQDLGAIVQPNIERVYALKPDLILITPLHVNQYQELSEIAPTIHYDMSFKDSEHHVDVVKNHMITLGKIFDKGDIARQKVAELDEKVKQVRAVTKGRPEKALVVLHNNGAFSNFGTKSRYGFVFTALGVKPASTAVDTNLHGQPISNEFIKQADPDILYIVDRTAVMEHRPIIRAEQVSNPLLRQTKAWKSGRVIFVDADAWYITAAGPTSLKIVMDDVMRGYQKN